MKTVESRYISAFVENNQLAAAQIKKVRFFSSHLGVNESKIFDKLVLLVVVACS